MNNKIKILVDGSNIAFFVRNEQKKAKLDTLEILINYLKKLSEEYEIGYQLITDASLKYRIDNRNKLEKYYKCGKIIDCPKGVRADDFLIEYAKRYPDTTVIISNDCFRDYDINGLLLIKFGLVFNDVILKPNLTDLLNSIQSNYLKEDRAIESI